MSMLINSRMNISTMTTTCCSCLKHMVLVCFKSTLALLTADGTPPALIPVKFRFGALFVMQRNYCNKPEKNSSICFNAFIWLDGCIRNSGCIYSLCRKVLSFSTVVQHKLIDFVVTLGLRWLSSHHVTKLSISQYIDYETGMMWM